MGGAAALLLAAAGYLSGQKAATYLEFGKVVALGLNNVEVQMEDPRLNRTVRRSFQLSRETRADLVHVGDDVEVIYTPAANGEWMLARLIALQGDIPTVGPAPDRPAKVRASRSTLPASTVATVKPAPPIVRPDAPVVARAATPGTPIATVPRKSRANLGRSASSRNSSTATLAKPAPSPATGSPTPATLVLPNSGTIAQVPTVIRVPLGGSTALVNPAAPRATVVAAQPMGDLCNRTAQWSSQPVTLAVLDFRYPTEKEEARDIAQVGGGSGTVLADEVYNLLADNPRLALSRGDRQKLFRMDFAGAARLGRQLGVDAVLLGTFVPVEVPNADPEFPPPTQAYTLRAGIVETCTGELLYKLGSESCPPSSNGSCSGSEITAKQATNPGANLQAFGPPLANLLAPVLEEGTLPGTKGDAGSITEVRGTAVTVRITPGASLRAGDQLGVHASRLAKIPSTNTLHVFRNELVGRVTLTRVSGGYAYGTFAGEPSPLPGDLADLITQ